MEINKDILIQKLGKILEDLDKYISFLEDKLGDEIVKWEKANEDKLAQKPDQQKAV
jgi:hypothetical protein